MRLNRKRQRVSGNIRRQLVTYLADQGRTSVIRVRIPEKATTLSGAWRPRDPVDDDQDGARA